MDTFTSKLCTKTVKEKGCLRRIRFSTSKDTTAANDDSIIVYARVKPTNQPDDDGKLFQQNTTIIKYLEKDKNGNEKLNNFSFHRVFSPTDDQQTLFDSTVRDSIDLIIAGENRLLFAYGTTSSGKTYTMLGNSENPGILPRCIVKVFFTLQELLLETNLCPDQGDEIRRLSQEELNIINQQKYLIIETVNECDGKFPKEADEFNLDLSGIESALEKLCYDINPASPSKVDLNANYALWITFAEVYNENIYDLLDILKERKSLKIGIDTKKNNYIKGLSHIQVGSWIEFWKVFLYGHSRSHINQTNLNKTSSRSHSIFTLKIVKTIGKKSSVNSLSVCDLAGTERQKKALNSGETLFESCNINTSLLVLNRCFTVIRENKVTNQKRKPPYRDSKLTMIFQKAFSYGEPITMFVTLSQSLELFEESKNVLKMSAVAQEMVKALPKSQDRFLKPKSKFSKLCTNPDSPPKFQGLDGHSGFMLLQDLKVETNNDNKLISYEVKIKELKKTIEESNDFKKVLLEVIGDAKEEFLNMEKKLEEAENKLAEEELLFIDKENDLREKEIIITFKQKQNKAAEQKYLEALKRIEELQKLNKKKAKKKEALELKLKERKQLSEPGRKGCPLQKSTVKFENLSPEMSLVIEPSATSTFIETEKKE